MRELPDKPPGFGTHKTSGGEMQQLSVVQKEFLEIRNYLDTDHRKEMMRDIREGLSKEPKAIPCKYFYDAHGSRLFEQICSTPEYYPTRTELSILDDSAEEIMQFFADEGGDLIELGSGSDRKIRKLFDALDPTRLSNVRYVPVDISESALVDSAGALLNVYEDLEILAIAADFTRHLAMLPNRRKLIAFFGSSIGNFPERQSIEFIENIARVMEPGDRFLLGLDMMKPIEVIEAAYNDEQGVTRQFNLNMLAHINRELNADFDVNDFEHRAVFNEDEERMELCLCARSALSVHISDLSLSVDFQEGERLHTEICQKFSRTRAERLFNEAGLAPVAWHSDQREWFTLVELQSTIS
jgi:L-histidine Nalpha-methyltransferase